MAFCEHSEHHPKSWRECYVGDVKIVRHNTDNSELLSAYYKDNVTGKFVAVGTLEVFVTERVSREAAILRLDEELQYTIENVKDLQTASDAHPEA